MGLVGSGEGSGGWPVLVCQRARAVRRGSGAGPAKGAPEPAVETTLSTGCRIKLVSRINSADNLDAVP